MAQSGSQSRGGLERARRIILTPHATPTRTAEMATRGVLLTRRPLRCFWPGDAALIVGHPGVLPDTAPSIILSAVLLQAGRPGVLPHAAPSTTLRVVKKYRPY